MTLLHFYGELNPYKVFDLRIASVGHHKQCMVPDRVWHMNCVIVLQDNKRMDPLNFLDRMPLADIAGFLLLLLFLLLLHEKAKSSELSCDRLVS